MPLRLTLPALLPAKSFVLRCARVRGIWCLVILAGLLPGWSAQTGNTPPVSASPAAVAGLTSDEQGDNGQSTLVLRSGGRFELHLYTGGIVAWYDLRRDPQRQHNLVASDALLLEHRLPDGTLLSAAPVLQELTAVRARVVWSSQMAALSQPATITYTIWTGGQIAVEIDSATRITTSLRRDPDALTGAVIQSQTSAFAAEVTSDHTLMLFLDAWTGESSQPLAEPQPATTNLSYNQERSAVQARALPHEALRLTLPPEVGLRQPRFEIADWPGSSLMVHRGATLLVEGQDYVADWDDATRQLTLQYLHLLPPGAGSDERTFELAAALAAPSLSLGIAERNLDENGLLVIDANMPDSNGVTTLLDTFKIPYIQSLSSVPVVAVLQGEAAGVELVLQGVATQRVFGAPGQALQAQFTLPKRGEYRLDGYLLNANGQRLSSTPNDSINSIGYGWIFSAIGDSITAGVGGSRVAVGDPRYPVSDASRSPESSADGRNFYQYSNALSVNSDFYRSYQPDLNNLLRGCSAAPIFILNDGFPGARTARFPPNQPPGAGNRNLLAKMPALNDHINKLGARGVLLLIGTNDATLRSPTDWAGDLNQVIDALQAPNPGLAIWVARIPWRADGQAFLNEVAKFNAQIPLVVNAQNQPGTPVALGPDFFSFFQNNPSLISEDKLHPNQAGYTAMAQLWADPVVLCGPLKLRQVMIPLIRR